LRPHRRWKQWEGTKQGKRGADYDEFKKVFEQRILEEVRGLT
jgi:hypothetical protein